jgi:PAS domain S-box-containing protein
MSSGNSPQGDEARLRAILDAAVDAIITIDENGIIMDLNPSTERMFGYAASDIVGKNVRLLMPEPYRGEHDRYLKNYLSTGEKKIIGIGREVLGQRKDESTFPMYLSVGESMISGRSIFIGIVHDITEQKKSESEIRRFQRMDVIGQLTGGIAHDFNNLLTVIIGNLEMLEPRVADEEQRVMIEQAQEAADLGANLTERLLAFARRQTLAPEIVDVNEQVLNMTELLRRTLGEAVQIGTVLESHLWRTRADLGQLENALLNLAINARDAMPGGGNLMIETANIELDATPFEASSEVVHGRYVVLSVTDSGIGMSEEVKERAFDPFFTTKEAGAGTGLGLSTVYGFAKQSGGHLTIYSEVGHGTTVRLYLPELAEDAAMVPATQKLEEDAPAAGETVLVVEDDARVRRTSILRLTDLGYKALEADNGEAALKILFGGHHVDLLFTDIVMPGGMDGPDLAQEAQRRLPALKVLFTSGYAEAGAVGSKLLQKGALLLRKPYKTSDLARKIREALST